MTKAELIQKIRNMNVDDNAQILVLVHSDRTSFGCVEVDGVYRPACRNEIIIEGNLDKIVVK